MVWVFSGGWRGGGGVAVRVGDRLQVMYEDLRKTNVMCHMSPVTCHQVFPNPLTAKSPTMHSRRVYQDRTPKPPKISKTPKSVNLTKV